MSTTNCVIYYFIFIVSHLTAFYMLSHRCKAVTRFYAVVDVCVWLFFTLMCQAAIASRKQEQWDMLSLQNFYYFFLFLLLPCCSHYSWSCFIFPCRDQSGSRCEFKGGFYSWKLSQCCISSTSDVRCFSGVVLWWSAGVQGWVTPSTHNTACLMAAHIQVFWGYCVKK